MCSSSKEVQSSRMKFARPNQIILRLTSIAKNTLCPILVKHDGVENSTCFINNLIIQATRRANDKSSTFSEEKIASINCREQIVASFATF